jgi:hypothetical protein
MRPIHAILEIARIFQNPENASVAQIVDAIADFAFFLGQVVVQDLQ